LGFSQLVMKRLSVHSGGAKLHEIFRYQLLNTVLAEIEVIFAMQSRTGPRSDACNNIVF